MPTHKLHHPLVYWSVSANMNPKTTACVPKHQEYIACYLLLFSNFQSFEVTPFQNPITVSRVKSLWNVLPISTRGLVSSKNTRCWTATDIHSDGRKTGSLALKVSVCLFSIQAFEALELTLLSPCIVRMKYAQDWNFYLKRVLV